MGDEPVPDEEDIPEPEEEIYLSPTKETPESMKEGLKTLTHVIN